MGQLKALARSRSRPEGSIAEGKVTEEVIGYYTDYLESVESIGLPSLATRVDSRVSVQSDPKRSVWGLKGESRHT